METTHSFAKTLSQLARALKSLPDVSMEEFIYGLRSPSYYRAASADDIAVNLSTLAALSKVDKAQWIELIREYGFPISLRPRDASRDILGKLLRFLEENPNALQMLQMRARRSRKASPELMRTLELLMRGTSKL